MRAARVACTASSTRCRRSRSSVSVGAPTLITPTPPISLAIRSRSLPLSKWVMPRDSNSARICAIRCSTAARSPRPPTIVVVIAVDDDALRPPELSELDRLEGQAQILGDRLAAGEDGDVLEHALAPLAELGGDDRDRGEEAAQLVRDQRLQRVALDHLRDHEQRPARLRDLVHHRDQTLAGGELLVGEQDEREIEHGLRPPLVGHHFLREPAPFEAHPVAELELDADGLAVLHAQRAVVADLSIASAIARPTPRRPPRSSPPGRAARGW